MTDDATPRVELSVVVTVTTGGEHVDRCLEALAGQRDAPRLEVIVPVDATIPDLARWTERFPTVSFPRIEAQPVGSGPGHQHLDFDRRRAAGLAAAHAPVVALTEDHARPAPDWCRRILAAHSARTHVAIGGAITDGSRGRIARAAYLCDFARYQPPLIPGPTAFLSDVNVSYKRAGLSAVASDWRAAYHETGLHDALRSQGSLLWLDPAIRVERARGPLRLIASLRERYAWGRLYAGKRVHEMSRQRRVALALLSPALPILLLARQLGHARRSRSPRFAGVLPALAVLLCAWSIGEAVGYWTGQPVARHDDDR